MRGFAVLLLAPVLLTAVDSGDAAVRQRLADEAAQAYETTVDPLLRKYCIDCHGAARSKGDVDFSLYPRGTTAIGVRSLWAKVNSSLKREVMPPVDEAQPTAAERQRLIDWVRSLRRLYPPDPGRVTIRRLNRAEYANTLRDLLGVDVKPAKALPPDDVGDGFDNMADVLSISPLLMEKYLLLADDALDRVVLDEQLKVTANAGDLVAIVDGAPVAPTPGEPTRVLAAPGEVVVPFVAPKDGKYTVKVRVGSDKAGDQPAKLAVKLDGATVQEVAVTATPKAATLTTCSFTAAAGERRLTLTFANPFTEPAVAAPADDGRNANAKRDPKARNAPAKPQPPAAVDEPARPRTRTLAIASIELVGPPPAGPPSEPQKRLIVARPGDDGIDEAEAAARIGTRFAERAFRRPVSADEIALLAKVFRLGRSRGETFTGAAKLMLKSVLVSPQFLFRIERDRPDLADRDGVWRIDDCELAARLSYFLWASMPDDELGALARAGKLHDDATLAAQVKRMIADPRSRALTENFSGQWLGLRAVFSVTPDEQRFPGIDDALRRAMYDEGVLLVDRVLREGRSIRDLVACDWTFLNERLAKHYGIAGVTGDAMRAVTVAGGERGGALTLAAVLMANSNPTRTSPVKRGRWVLDQLLAAPPPPPPAMVKPLDEQGADIKGLPLRQRLELHRRDAQCASCHAVMDQIGFGLEGFDAVGRARALDEGHPVDASGELPGGRRFAGAAQLKQVLLERPRDLARALAAQLLTYALGRKVGDADDDAVDAIVDATERSQWRFDAMVEAIVRSYPFQYRSLPRR